MGHRTISSTVWASGCALLTLSITGAGVLVGRQHHSPVPSLAHALPQVSAPKLQTPLFDAAGQRFGWLEDGSAEAAAIARELGTEPKLQALDRAGLRIYCTLDSGLQQAAAKTLREHTQGTDALQISLLAVENETGAVRALAGRTGEALPPEAEEAAMYASGGTRRAPYLIARVCSQSGELLYRAEPAEEPALPAETAWKALQQQQAALTAQLGGLAARLPSAGPGGSESLHEATFTGCTSALTCSVRVSPEDSATLLARGHAESVALPAWRDFMTAAAEGAYPATAFQAPLESTVVEEIPLVRRAVAVVHEPEIRRALPVVPPTIAFGGAVEGQPVDLRQVEPRIERAIPVNQELAAQQAMVTRPVGLDEGPVSTGNGFVVFPRAVRRDAISWSR